MSRKLKIIHIACFCIFIIFAMTTFAFIIQETTSTSVLTFGSLKMRLIETTIENGVETEIESGSSINITNNSNINRNVKIENIGNQEMYVRVALNIQGKKDNLKFDATSLVDIKADSENWIYKDGWYYYKNSIKPNELTDNLKINIDFKIDKISSTYSGGNFNLYIDSEALQYKNNSENVLEARGWPSN